MGTKLIENLRALLGASGAPGEAPRGEILGLFGVLGVGLMLGVMILRMEPGKSGEDGHGHGHGAEEEHEEKGVELDDDVVAGSAIGVETAGAATVRRVVKLRGRLSTDRDRTVDIAPRFPGVIQRMHKNLGDPVRKGELLAIVESAAARSAFEVRSGITGVVVDRQGVRGGFTSTDEPLYKVVDLSSVWAEFDVPDTDQQGMRVGQKARITLVGSDAAIESSVSYVSPQVQEDTQSMLVRVTLDNRGGALKPGSFVEAEILTDSVSAAVAVKREAVQTYEDRPVVFVRDSGRFEPRPVKLGATGLDIVQVLHGLKAGESYATVNSFIVKAELLKSTAEHVH